MPASKGGPAPHDSQSNMKRQDEVGETSPATNNRSLTTGDAEENTAVPRIKKKRSASEERLMKPASPPPNDSSKTISDPPVKKAKLLNATSASCGEAPSQKANSKASLKRTASTDSEDESSSDGIKTDLFRERDEGDKARCIRKYSNRVKAKRKAEEPPSDQQETSQESPSEPADTIQMDHDYGRLSDKSSGSESFQDDTKPSVTESEQEKNVGHAAQEKSEDNFGPASENKKPEFTNVENQELTDKAPASCREISDCISDVSDTPGITNEAEKSDKTDISEPLKSQKGPDDERQASLEENLNSCARKETLNCEAGAQVNMNADVRSDADAKETVECVSEEVRLDTKYENEEGGQKVHGLEAPSHEKNKSDIPESHSEETVTTESAGNPMTQTDLSVKIQVTFKAESKPEHLEDGVNHEVPDRNTNSCDVNEIVRKSEEKLQDCEKEAEFLSSQTLEGHQSLREVQPSTEVIDRMTESCTEPLTPDCKAMREQTQAEMLSSCVTASEGQTKMDAQTKITTEERSDTAQNHENHRVTEKTAEIPVEVEGNLTSVEQKKTEQNNHVRMELQASATSQHKLFNQAAVEDIQNLKSQESVIFSQDNLVFSKTVENEGKVTFDPTTVPENQIRTVIQSAPKAEICNLTPAVYFKSHKVEFSTDLSVQNQQNVIVESSEVLKNEDAFKVKYVSRPGSVIMKTSEISTMKVQSKESSQTSEGSIDMSDQAKGLPVGKNESFNNEDMVHAAAETQIKVDTATTVTSLEVSDWAPTTETHALMSQEATEAAIVTSEKVQKSPMCQTPESNGNENGEITVTESQREEDMQRSEVFHATNTVVIKVPQSREATEPTTNVSEESQKSLVCQTPQANKTETEIITECVSTTEDQRGIDLQIAATPESLTCEATVEMQSQKGQDVSEFTTDKKDFIIASTESGGNKDEIVTGSVDVSEYQTVASQSTTVSVVLQCQEAGDLKSKDLVTSELDMVPGVPVNMETASMTNEISNEEKQQHQTMVSVADPSLALSNGIPKPPPFADSENPENQNMQPSSEAETAQEDGDLMSGSAEKTDSACEKEVGRQAINIVKEEGVILYSENAERTVRDVEGHTEETAVSDVEGHREETVGNDVIVFVCSQPDDMDFVIQASEEEIKTVNQSEVGIHENQVIYEPISSPESDDGRQISIVPENHVGFSVLDVCNTENHQIGDFSANEENKEMYHQEVEAVEQQICTSESHEVEMEEQAFIVPESCVSAQLKQVETSEDEKQVAVISCSDGTSMPDGQAEVGTEKGELNGYPDCAPEVTEHVQEGPELQGEADVTVTTTTSTAEVEIPDSTSEEFVILEPVPESEIHFDIVTQAAAESGLSVSLSEQLNPVGAFAVEAENQVLNGSQQTITIPEPEVQQCQITDTVNDSTASSSRETLGWDAGPEAGMSSEQGEDLRNSDHNHQPSSDSMEVSNQEIALEDSQVITEDCNAEVSENPQSDVVLQDVQILEDIEIGREIVVAEEDNEEDEDITIIGKPQETSEVLPAKTSEIKVDEPKKNDTAVGVLNQTNVVAKTDDDKKEAVPEKPKKQEMNTQARTKARLAALAEQKAAAAKRPPNRQQMNLLALCQEIAEDIATDSMLLKKIEEEKQAAAVAAASAAAKSEASKRDSQPENKQEAGTVNVATAAGPEECSASATPATEEVTADKVSTASSSEAKPVPCEAEPASSDVKPASSDVKPASSDVKPASSDVKPAPSEAKPSADAPKRRFFITQVSVPLKAHEKKKLTRYQRLRQVELQREKMSWARMKKLKSDQANQMFSDIDWQAPLSSFSLTPKTTAPPSTASPSKTSSPSPSPSTKPATPKAEVAKVDSPKAEPRKTETSKAEPVRKEPASTEPTKPETASTQTPKTGTPAPELRKSTRLSKAQTVKPAPTPAPAQKVTKPPAKRVLPAVPPPMPNGVKAQKQKPIEYIPYKPRPKYSFEDFELDDDPVPSAKPSPQTRPTQPPRPNIPSNPTAQPRATVSSPLSNQAKLKAQSTPTRQISDQSRPAGTPTPQPKSTVATAPLLKATATTAVSSKGVPTAGAQVKPPALVSPQPKSDPAPNQAKPAASASPHLKPAVSGRAAGIKQSTPAAPQPTGSAATEEKLAATPEAEPQKPQNPSPADDSKCKETADPLPSASTSSEPSEVNLKESDGTQKCEEKPAVPAVDPSPEDIKETDTTSEKPCQDRAVKPKDGETPLSEASLQKEVKKLKEADKDGTQTIIDAGQKHFGAVACSVCGMLYSAANPEDESQHLLFHNQFISAVKYVGWKKERILAEFPDGKIILVLPDDPKYALKKVEEIREMVDNDLGFQQVGTKCPSQTKTFLFISNDKKVGGCLIAEHIQEGYRVIEDPTPEGSEGERLMFERQRAWCCSTTPEPAICGISRIWVVSVMRRQGIASRMLECLRNNFVYGSYLSKDEIAFSDPTPDGKLFATNYFGTSQFLVYNFVSATPSKPKTDAV